jgi:DNA-binding beta-propeller fold protein YncE
MTENLLLRAGVSHFEVTEVPDYHRPEPTHPVYTFAGSGTPGFGDGSTLTADFDAPTGVAIGNQGEIYVTDSQRHLIRVVWPEGKVTTLAGCEGKPREQDGDGPSACFNTPAGIVRRPDGALYVADAIGQRIRLVTPQGHVTTVAGTGHKGRVDAQDPMLASFTFPRGLALAPDGTLYIAEPGSGLVRKLDKSGVSTVAEIGYPTGVAVAEDNTLYVVDSRAATIVRVQDGKSTAIVGAYGQFGDRDGPASEARIRASEGIFVDGDRVVFSDTANHKVRVLSLANNTVTTLAGSGGTTIELELPRFLIKTPRGIVIADSGHHRLALLPD